MDSDKKQDDPCDDIVKGPDWFEWFDKKSEKKDN